MNFYDLFRKYIWSEKAVFKFKKGQYFRFENAMPQVVDNGWNVLLHTGGLIISDGRIEDGRRVYDVDCTPEDTNKEELNAEFILYEDSLIACTAEEYERLGISNDTDCDIFKVIIEPNAT